MGTALPARPAQTLYVTIRREELRQLKEERDQLQQELAQLRQLNHGLSAQTVTALHAPRA